MAVLGRRPGPTTGPPAQLSTGRSWTHHRSWPVPRVWAAAHRPRSWAEVNGMTKASSPSPQSRHTSRYQRRLGGRCSDVGAGVTVDPSPVDPRAGVAGGGVVGGADQLNPVMVPGC